MEFFEGQLVRLNRQRFLGDVQKTDYYDLDKQLRLVELTYEVSSIWGNRAHLVDYDGLPDVITLSADLDVLVPVHRVAERHIQQSHFYVGQRVRLCSECLGKWLSERPFHPGGDRDLQHYVKSELIVYSFEGVHQLDFVGLRPALRSHSYVPTAGSTILTPAWVLIAVT